MRSLPDSCVASSRTPALRALILASVTSLAATSLGQVPASTSAPAAPSTAPASTAPAASAPVTARAEPVNVTTTTAPTTAPTTQPFVGVITADRVYVRPGPGTEYYQLVQLGKNDTVQVIGLRGTWYQILPPANVYCLVAASYVEPDADGKTGTVKGDYVNVRAGSAIQTARADAVLSIARRGTKLTLLGTVDIAGTKYYKIAPLEKTHVYIASQYVRVAPGGTVPRIAEAPHDTFVEVTPPPGPTTATATQPVEPTHVVVVPPQPATTFAPGAYEKFAELNKKTIDELRKSNVMDQDAGTMLENWQTFLRTENLPPSIKQASEARVAAAQRILELQKAAKETRGDDSAFAQQRKALQEQSDAALKAVEAAQSTGPYIAEGILRSSPVVTGRYALVNPITQRVVAYVDPSSEIDLSRLLDQYIGVRGVMAAAKEGEIKVVKVRNATLLPTPKVTTGEH